MRLPAGVRDALGGAGPGLLLALGAALPLARVLADPTRSLPGFDRSDLYKHVWSYWHTPRVLAEGTWPWTPYLGAPDGGVLLDVMLLPSLLMWPVTAAGGPVLAANVWIWLSFLAVGVATYGICRYTVGSRVASTCAGLVAQTSPYLLGYPLASGVHERLAVWVFPAVLLALFAVRDGRGARWGVAGGGALLFATMGCQVYGVFLVAAVLLLLPVLWRGPGGPVATARRLAPTAAGLGTALIAAYLAVRWATAHDATLAPQSLSRYELSFASAATTDVATLANLLDPRAAKTQKAIFEGDMLLRVVYLGWVPLLAAIAGGVRALRQRRWDVVALVVVALAFALLSLGADLPFGDPPVGNPLHSLLTGVLPLYGNIPPRWQQVGVYVPLAAVGVAALVAAPSTRGARIALGGAIVALTLAERWYALPMPLVAMPMRAEVPEIYRHVSGGGLLVDVPRAWRTTLVTPGIVFFAQTVHQHPIPISINFGDRALDREGPLLRGATGDGYALLQQLREAGVRWVVVHPDWFAPNFDPYRFVGNLAMVAGPPRAQEGSDLLWDLGADPAPLP